jgi:DNA-binding transcriptional MerR regulator
MMIKEKGWKIGELVKQTGLTVWTLHHYDRIGLLCPSRYSAAGHRLYTEADIGKLQQILSLKQLGFALETIKTMLEKPVFHPEEVIRMHLDRLNEHIRLQENLCSRLQHLFNMLKARQDVTAEQFIKTITRKSWNWPNSGNR